MIAVRTAASRWRSCVIASANTLETLWVPKTSSSNDFSLAGAISYSLARIPCPVA
jgi:hypothetical protein